MPKKKATIKKTVGKTRKQTSKKTTTTKAKKDKAMPIHSDLTKMQKPQEYMEYVYFMALPRTLRAETLGLDGQADVDFTAKYKVNKNTLTEWRKRVGFWDDVQTVRKEFFRARSGDVLLALETTCIREGKGTDVRVYLTYTGEYSDKVEQEHKVHPELQAALEKIGTVLG